MCILYWYCMQQARANPLLHLIFKIPNDPFTFKVLSPDKMYILHVANIFYSLACW